LEKQDEEQQHNAYNSGTACRNTFSWYKIN